MPSTDALPAPVPVRPLRSPWPWVGLCLGLVLTAVVWVIVHKTEKARLEVLRQAEATSLANELKGRMKGLEQVLHGAAGYLGRGALPNRVEWRAYVDSLELELSYPGFQGLGFAEWIPQGGLDAHVHRLRKEGFPDYRVQPGGTLPPEPDGCSAIIYLEPMDDRNQRAFGKDMLSEATRRAAMMKARDTGLLTLTGPVTLYQEKATEIQTGTLLYAPVYDQGLPQDTVAERRRAFRGWAYIPFRMNNLVSTALSHSLRTVDLTLFDATEPGAPGLLFDTNLGHAPAEKADSMVQSFEVAGRVWQARTHPNAGFFTEAGQRRHWELLAGGVVMSLLLFTVLIVFQGAEARARRLAQLRGEELLASEAQFRALFDLLPLGVTLTGDRGHILASNRASEALLGIPTNDLMRRDFKGPYWDILRSDGSLMPPEEYASVRAMKEQRRVEDVEMGVRRPDGQVAWILVTAEPIPADGYGVLIVYRDISAHRLAQQQLIANEADLTLAQEIGEFGSWRVVYEGGAEAWSVSEGLRRIYGYQRNQPITRDTGFEVMHPEDRVFVQAAWSAAMAGTGPCEWEHRIVVGNEVRWVSVRVQCQLSPEGRLLEASGIVQDITRKKATEEALRLSVERLRLIGDQLPDSFLYQFLSKPGEAPRFLHLTAGVERLCGLKADEVMRDPGLLFSTVDPAQMPAYLEAEAASARDLTPFVMDLRQRHTDGNWRWFRVRSMPRPQPDGSVIWEGISTDVTDRHQSRLRLEESEARFRAVIEDAPAPLFLHRDGRFVYLNPASLRLMKAHSAEELIGQPVLERVHPEDRAQVVERIRLALATGREAPLLEERFIAMDGSVLQVETLGRAVMVDGQPTILAFAQDVTARKQAEATELRAQKAESLVLMAGSIAHDFNNIFHGVLGFIEVAKIRAGRIWRSARCSARPRVRCARPSACPGRCWTSPAGRWCSGSGLSWRPGCLPSSPRCTWNCRQATRWVFPANRCHSSWGIRGASKKCCGPSWPMRAKRPIRCPAVSDSGSTRISAPIEWGRTLQAIGSWRGPSCPPQCVWRSRTRAPEFPPRSWSGSAIPSSPRASLAGDWALLQ